MFRSILIDALEKKNWEFQTPINVTPLSICVCLGNGNEESGCHKFHLDFAKLKGGSKSQLQKTLIWEL